MEIIFLSIGCIANSIAIIILLVSHFRGNRSKGRGMTYADIKRSFELNRKMRDVNHAGDVFSDYCRKTLGDD